MIKFVQATYPFLLLWVAFTHRKIANLEESLSQVKETNEESEHLHPLTPPDYDSFIPFHRDETKDEGSEVMIEDINNLDADADKGTTTLLNGNMVKSKSEKKKHNPAKQTFNHANHGQLSRKKIDIDVKKNHDNYDKHQRRLSRSVDRKQRKLSSESLNFKRKQSDLRQENSTSYNTTTTCFLLHDLDFTDFPQNELNTSITTFDFTLDLMTDDRPYETSWKLLPQNSNDTIIDSSDESATSSELVDSTLHKFEYRCVVSSEEPNEAEYIRLENICYNFELHDSWGNGICCYFGLGYYSLSLNNNTTPTKSGPFYSSSLLFPFCLDNNKSSENKLDTSSKYPSRECLHEPCICDSKPRLSNIKEDDDEMFDTKVLTLNEIMMTSDSKALADYKSPQYKAACWVLHDDPFFHDDNLDVEKRQQRMMQRYLLAVMYFTTMPEYLYFLSSKSECEWNQLEFNNLGEQVFIGIRCDENNYVVDINLGGLNLEGTIVDELAELRTLEYLNLAWNNIRGAVPSTLGRLSELRYLNLGRNKLEGTIPPQLFNATNLYLLGLHSNRLEGTIPETIGNIQKLNQFSLGANNLSGSIPDSIYSLKNLQLLELDHNKLSSSISPMIGNLNKLKHLSLGNNMLTGQIPSTISSLYNVDVIIVKNNRLSGLIPGFLPPNLYELQLEENSLTGSIPGEFCERKDSSITADCRNDVFEPEVSCSCCDMCTDGSPTWNGDCADTTIKVIIHHEEDNRSHHLKWSLTNDATGKNVLNDGRYLEESGSSTYETCVAQTDCFSMNMILSPEFNTKYDIQWNDKLIHDGTFPGHLDNIEINIDDPAQTLLSFSYNKENQQRASCGEVTMQCSDDEQPVILKSDTTKRIMYNEATKISGKAFIRDTSSSQSKALCWLLQNHSYFDIHNNFETKFTQKYVFTLLHLSSSTSYVFGTDEYPPLSNECQWQGLRCKGDSDIITEISLEKNQTIGGTLIQELGSLAFLEKLDLSHSEVNGTIPQVFSNLWSLKEINLSGNRISGTLPATLFRQLNKLEYIDLSENSLVGTINKDIVSYSPIRSLSLSKNQLTGLVTLDSFHEFHLEYFNISANKLNNLDFSLLSKHRNLKTVDISANFFVGSLEEDMFEPLAELEYFNISQNAFTGMIPTTFHEASNITTFDAHVNRLKGNIPNSISFLSNLQYLNLQGNELTGSLPSEINSLKKLETLVLSHNKLKGSIPLRLDELPNIQRLHLHKNNLVGKAPDSISRQLKSYYTDCGHPSTSLDPITCPSCNKCCNADGLCQEKSIKEISQITATLIFLFTVVGIISLLYIVKDKITSSRLLQNFFNNTVNEWNASTLLSDKSVYHFLLAQNKTEWRIAFACGIFQADIANETSDKQYTFTCPSNTLECEDSRSTTGHGIFIFSVILVIWLLRDIIDSTKLMLLSFQKKSIDYFFASGMIFTVTMLSLWTSITYIIAIATKNTELIKDAVVLLFVIEVDERLFQLVERINPNWVRTIERSMRGSLVLNFDDLVISGFVKKSNERYKSVKRNIHKSYKSLANSSRKEVEVHEKPHDVADESRP